MITTEQPDISNRVATAIIDEANRASDYYTDELGAVYISQEIINSWTILPIQNLANSESKRVAVRLNCMANLFYFARFVLGFDRLQTNPDISKNLHFNMCACVMKDGLKEVIEIPRDHYKSTIFSQAFPIWRALPFDERDEELMRKLGYGDTFIQWMTRAHNRDVRILIASETQHNAIKLGTKLSTHYLNNELFKWCFPEVIPDATCTWTNESLHQRRTPKGKQHGEGTFDLIGVGAALQSRHYDDVVQDDLVGRKALKSEVYMQSTIEYHQLLVGAFDADPKNGGRDNNEIVVGNRWSFKDLNSHIRENETYFKFVTHSALGGCCSLHPYGTPIFPEAFTIEKLARWKERLKAYLFSCQFLNFPINPELCKFELKDLSYYHFEKDYSAQTGGQMPFSHLQGPVREVASTQQKTFRVKIIHEVKEGMAVKKDIYPTTLDRYIIVDPNHSGKKGRCRHAITVTGVNQATNFIYLLDVWAKSTDPAEFVDAMFRKAVQWRCNTIWLETVGAQKYLKYHLEYFKKVNASTMPEIQGIKIKDLKYDNQEDAKKTRIESLEPIFNRGQFLVNSQNTAMRLFLEEYEAYGNKNGLIDILDTLGYGPQVWQFDAVSNSELAAVIAQRALNFQRAMHNIQN
jgi:hypothetical protein